MVRPHRPGVAAPPQPDDAGEVEADRQHRGAEEEPVDAPRGEPVGAGHRPGVGVAAQLEDAAGRRGRVGHRRHAARQHRGQPGRGAHDGDLDDGEPREHPPVTRALREHLDDVAPVQPAEHPEHDDGHRLQGHDRAVRREQPVDRPEPDPGLLHPGQGHRRRSTTPRRSSSGPRSGRGRHPGAPRMTSRAISPPVHTTTPSRCTPSALTAVLVARRPRGVTGEGQDDDRGQGEQREPGHRRPSGGEPGRHRHHHGDERADQQHPGRLEGPGERDQLVDQGGAVQRRAGEVGEGQHHLEQRGDRPHRGGRRGVPRRRAPGGACACARARGRRPAPADPRWRPRPGC